MKTKRTDTVPANARQAFKILDGMLTDEEKKEALTKTRSEFASDEHFGLGLWIRNNWIYGKVEDDLCFGPPDIVSQRWLERYYDHLKRVKKEGK